MWGQAASAAGSYVSGSESGGTNTSASGKTDDSGSATSGVRQTFTTGGITFGAKSNNATAMIIAGAVVLAALLLRGKK
jgi:hypothetical protein